MGRPIEVKGPWRVSFLEGGPSLPDPIVMKELKSWTRVDDRGSAPALRAFSGAARYTAEFDKPPVLTPEAMIDLGRVCHHARVTLNGRCLGTLLAHPFRIRLGDSMREGRNTLEIDITNLPANRVIDMERRNIPWCDYMFVYVNRAGSSPRDWHPFPSGLLGPVRLIPMQGSRTTEE